uniref:NADH-ubiquinone oxidoreductase chain 5 n=1 Tax=Malcus inconspicuus TaxID=498929 RepID=B7SMG0_9HEMI|nr:NADH dehydrogenase subunit 5 [Malcus inconspicuus]ABZ02054.1 NADH dehydrogenase subunit 5 [Malcus inconspicuus]
MFIYFFIMIFILSVFFLFLGLYFLSLDLSLLIDWEIVSYHSSSMVMTLLFDWMSLLFVSGVMLISSLVVFYSSSYMFFDNYSVRFLFLVLLFVMSMCLMILSPNLISILLGWDGLGLVSYLLVIYFQNYKSYNAGMLTVLVNRIGDVFILLSISLLFNVGGWYFLYYNYYVYGGFNFMFLFIVLASFTKSAQIPFSAWLPAAMAAPTPVSALVHSSTLVTAGVYLLIRFYNLIGQFDLSFFLILSVLTMLMSGLGANFEFDMKSIIALSTLSQLGMMMSILFMGYPIISFFHLLVHAFFKALLFLCAGLFIHCLNNSQDIRFMGGLCCGLPYVSSCFILSNFALCGLPFLSGFYSKDMILEILTMNYYNLFIYFLFYLSMGLTVSYSLRLLYYSMFGYINLFVINYFVEDKLMMFSMYFLCLMGIFSGSVLSWLLFKIPLIVVLPLSCKVLVLLFILIGLFMGYEISIFGLMPKFYNLMYFYFINMWFMPYFKTFFIYSNSFLITNSYLKVLDWGWGEFLMSMILSIYTIYLNKLILFLMNNNLKIFYCLFLIFALVLLLF